MEQPEPLTKSKTERESPFPIRMGSLRPELEKEALEKGFSLTEYILILLKSRNESRESAKDSEIIQLKADVARKNDLLKIAAKKLEDWGISNNTIKAESANG